MNSFGTTLHRWGKSKFPSVSQVEISHLKARQSGLQEEVQKLQRSAQSAASSPAVLPVTTASLTATSSSPSIFLTRPTGPHHGFHSDEMDISDVLWSQQEINKLSTEVMRLEAEVAHWRRMSQVKQSTHAKTWSIQVPDYV